MLLRSLFAISVASLMGSAKVFCESRLSSLTASLSVVTSLSIPVAVKRSCVFLVILPVCQRPTISLSCGNFGRSRLERYRACAAAIGGNAEMHTIWIDSAAICSIISPLRI